MVEDKVLQLNDMSVNELKDLWRQYFDSEPIWKTKRYYIPRLAYRMQELVYGGVPENIKNILLGKTIRREFSDEHIDGLPKVGTRLVKMYRGKEYSVIIYIYVMQNSTVNSIALMENANLSGTVVKCPDSIDNSQFKLWPSSNNHAYGYRYSTGDRTWTLNGLV